MTSPTDKVIINPTSGDDYAFCGSEAYPCKTIDGGGYH